MPLPIHRLTETVCWRLNFIGMRDKYVIGVSNSQVTVRSLTDIGHFTVFMSGNGVLVVQSNDATIYECPTTTEVILTRQLGDE